MKTKNNALRILSKASFKRSLSLVLGLGLLSTIGVGLVLEQSAECGRRPYAFTFDTELLKKGDFEFEQWTWGKASVPGLGKPPTEWLWFGPVYGLTNDVEIAVPWEMVASPASTSLTNITLDLRMKMLKPESEGGGFFSMMTRVYYQFNVNRPVNVGSSKVPWIGLNFIGSFGDPKGSHATIDLGGYTDVIFNSPEVMYQTLGLGYSHQLSSEWRVGAEYFHEISLGTTDRDLRRVYLGPNVAFARGQLWTTLGVLFGLTTNTPDAIGRLVFGVSI